ncbi:MAG: sulfatase-like hydrolase/transferase [Lachnospiraceae bacterium]|nr:sulfatase-like hydrolase/transferase [Lachnospiraceae bacterium]
MKNLVVLHLESVSKLIYEMNPQAFPHVRSFSQNCMRYRHYYATATSTAMVMNDILYGDFYRTENTKRFGEFIQTHKKAESFADVLATQGYRTLGVHYPAALGNEINPGHMFAKQQDLVNYADYAKALSDVERTMDDALENNGNFMIYFCNEVSHLCYCDERKFHIKNPTDRWLHGYRVIDKTIGDILTLLQERKQMKDTTIILYGDHGDDFYGHGFNGGYAHSIEPYANIVHTPFMVYDETLGAGEIDDVICSLDIKQIAYNLIGFDCQENPFVYDRYHCNRKYVFSRNLFAGQTPKKIDGYISDVRKAYGITTPQYSLLLTEEGWRMYLNQMDCTCSNNILDFFWLYRNRLRHICELNFLCVHYKSYMGHGTIGEIQREFARLSKWMRRELTLLEKETKQKEVLKHSCEKRIFYTKNMVQTFAVIAIKRQKKQLKKKLGELKNR